MKVEVVDSDEENVEAPAAMTGENPSGASAVAADDGQGAEEFVEASVVEEPEADEDVEEELPGDPVASDDEVFSLADLQAARKAASDAHDRYLRLEAEWDNYRKRTARERIEERERAAEELVTRLLPVVDDMERAIDHAANTNPEGEFSQFVDGVRAVYAKLTDALRKSGVEVIDPAGQPFNMHEHQAVANVEDDSVYDETVRDVYQKGYRMGKRVIRTAMVTITKGGPVRPVVESEE